MIPFYLINLDRSSDRLAWMSRRLEELKIPFQRVSAIDGKKLSPAELDRWDRVREKNFGLGPNELACFLSHRLCWQKIANGTDEYGFIAEDDIHISDQLPSFLRETDWIPSDAELLKAETINQRVWLSSTIASTHADYQLRQLRSTHAGAAGYILSRSGAAKLVTATENYCMSPDQVVFNISYLPARNLVAYQIEPALVAQIWAVESKPDQPKLDSLILNERNSYHVKARLRNRSLAGLIWYKLSNPLKKAGKRGLEVSANLLGTHRVTRVAFDYKCDSAAA